MGKNIKLPLAAGFAALCNHIKAIKQTAELSGSAVSALAQATAASMEEIEGILSEKADAGHKHTAADVGALPSSGGTLTGNLNGQYITGTWLKTTAATDLNKAAGRIPVLDSTGWLYYRTAEELLDDLGGAKKPLSGSVTIPKTGWASEEIVESGEDMADMHQYSYYYDIAVDGITAKDRADVTIAPGSVETATVCGLCPTTETLTGKIRLRSVNKPSESIAAEYWLCSGKE